MWDFECFLQLLRDDSLCSESGKLLRACGTATVKARSPMVERREHGTTSCEVDEDLETLIQGRRLAGQVQTDTVVLTPCRVVLRQICRNSGR